MIQVFKGGFWSIEDVIKSPNKIFIYGDNDLRTGLGGQAIIRNESNTLGIRTKKKPTHEKDAYYTDKEFEDNKKKIIQDIKKISDELLFGTTIIFSEGGYGTDRAKLKEKAPKTFKFLCDILLEKFGYHNELGKIVPRPQELKNAKELSMSYEHNKLGHSQLVPGQFRQELLEQNIFSTFDAIKVGLRTATTRTEKFKMGENIIFKSNKGPERLVCKVLCDSYPVTSISKEEWSRLEGWLPNYFDLNPDTLKKYQFRFEYLYSI
jgi:hypothetical protein